MLAVAAAMKEKMSVTVEKEKDRKMFVGFVWNSCAANFMYRLTAFLFLCSLLAILQFLPTRFSLSAADLRRCLSNITSLSPSPSYHLLPEVTVKDQVLENGVVKRAFIPYGSAAYSFVLMSAYRGGPNTFAVIGLASKPLQVFGKLSYQCQWVPLPPDISGGTGGTAGEKEEEDGVEDHHHDEPNIFTHGETILPDWGYGRVYTVVVVNCTFSSGANNHRGGKLLLHATINNGRGGGGGGGRDTNFNTTETIEALTETSEDFKNFELVYHGTSPKYDYLYCGSCLYGNLSPQRVREWLAYHIRLFGEKSHFVFHDAGGVHPEVMEVLKPWMQKGYVTLHDIREQERFDGYYHNQFLVVNDCLHRHRFMSKWIFFFDVDEFIFVPKSNISHDPDPDLKAVMDSLSGYTQFTIEQMPMSNKLCLAEEDSGGKRSTVGGGGGEWGFEKLVYKDVKRGIRRDRKYAVQPRNVFATGVHMSLNMVGKTARKKEGRIMYFHYHGTIAERREPCRQMVNATHITVDGTPYSLDASMRNVGGFVKRFELEMIGSTLLKTQQ